MALLPRIQTNFLNADSTAQLSAQQLGSGFDALAGGISKGFEQRRQNEQLRVKAAADKAASDRKLGMIEMKNTMDTIEKITGGDEEQMKVLFGKVDPRFAIGGKLDISGLAKGKTSELVVNLRTAIDGEDYLSIQKAFNMIQTEGSKKQKETAKDMFKTVVKPLPFKTSVSLNDIEKRLKLETPPLPMTTDNIKMMEDRIAKEKSTRLALEAAEKVSAVQLAENQENVYGINDGALKLDINLGTLKDDENLVSLNNDDAKKLNSIKDGMKNKINLIQTMREGLSSKDGLAKSITVMKDFFTNSRFTKQFKPANITKMNGLIKAGLSTMMQEMGMGKVASDRDMESVFANFGDIADPDAANEFRLAIFEDATDNLVPNFLKSKRIGMDKMTPIITKQLDIMKSVANLMTDNENKKDIMGENSTFSDFFKKARSGKVNGQRMTMNGILNAWNSPGGLSQSNKTMSVDIATEANRGDGIPPNESKRERIIRETRAKFGN